MFKTGFSACIFCVLCCVNGVFAQTSSQVSPKKEKLNAALVGFITTQLQLSPAEAQTFWPIWNQYHAEMESHNQLLRQIGRDNQDKADKLTDVESEKLIQTLLKTEGDITATRQKYVKDFAKVVGHKRTLKLYVVERKFQQRVVNEMQKRKGQKK